MFPKVRFPVGRLTILTTVLVLLTANSASAQELITDTLRILDTSIRPGDTAMLSLYITNSEKLGGYSVRFTYDTSMIEPVIVSEEDPTIYAVQLRGDFVLFAFGRSEPGIVSGVASFYSSIGLEAGIGIAVRLPFYAKEYAPEDTITPITFIEHPYSPNSSNWFAPFDGLSQYLPTWVDGSVLVGCDCTDHGDYNEDGQIGPLDVTFAANYVYLGWGFPQQLTSLCPLDCGDWDCDGSVNPLDVVHYVNLVYLGYGSGPCDPCAE